VSEWNDMSTVVSVNSQYKNSTERVGLLYVEGIVIIISFWNVACCRHDIAGNLLTWRYTTISICHFNTCNIWEGHLHDRRLTKVGLLCLTPLSTIFQLYRGCQFYWWRKLEFQEKTSFICEGYQEKTLDSDYKIHILIRRNKGLVYGV
jgi:hypothetical protein